MTMRILQIVTQMEGGGSQRAAILSARELCKRGHEIETVFLFRRRGVYDDEPGVYCLWPQDPSTPLDYLRIFWRLFAQLRKSRPDGVLTFTHYSNVFGCLLALLAGIPQRVARQTGLPQHNPALARHLDYLFGSLGIYTSIVANSNTTLAAFGSYPAAYRRRLSMVPNGIETGSGKWSDEGARIALGLPLGIFILASVGRLSASKNHSRLLDALAKCEDIHLVSAGDGEERVTLEAQIQMLGLADRVTLLGDIPSDEMGRVYAASNAFIHPTLFESFGIVTLEAAAAGLPLLLSDIPAIRELTGGPDAGNALYFDPECTEQIVAAIVCIVNDGDLREKLSARAPRLIEPYSIGAMADGFLDSLGYREERSPR